MEGRSGLGLAFTILAGRIRIGDDASTCRNVGLAIAHNGRADSDSHIEIPGEIEVADRPTVDATPCWFIAFNEFHSADLRGTGQSPGRKGRGEDVQGADSRSSP
jgi:hypothetical protein